MGKSCPKCGKLSNGIFCTYCGEPLTLEAALYKLTSTPEFQKKFQDARKYLENFPSVEDQFYTSDDASVEDQFYTSDYTNEKKDELSVFHYTEHSDGTVTITGLKDKNISEIKIPDIAVAIGEYAFATCEKLRNVTLGYRVTTIGECAFFSCGITSIHLPNRVTSIGKSAFNNCKNLSSIYMPESVTSIGESAFSGCSSLTSIHIPNSVTSIGEGAFFKCGSLTTIYLPTGISYLGRDVFLGCENVKSLYLENSNILSNSWSRFLSDDSVLDKLRLPDTCRVFRR